jgi:Zn-finger protein
LILKNNNTNMKYIKTQKQLNEDSCKNCNITKDRDLVDKYADIIIKHLNDWKSGKYNKDSEYVGDLVSNLIEIDVLFKRDIEKE